MAKVIWSEHELVKKHIEMAVQNAQMWAHQGIRWHLVNWVDREEPALGSPIEACFSVWWSSYSNSGADFIFLKPQHEVDVYTDGTKRSYRLDFVVDIGDELVSGLSKALRKQFKFAIELDGHEFHERTKEQVTYRNRRDRDLQADGWVVYHVSGSELAREPQKVVHSVFTDASLAVYRFKDELALALTGKSLETWRQHA